MPMPLPTQTKEAFANLQSGGKRTVLALVGIVVGIGAVIALLTTGAMAKSEALKQFESLGTDMLSVFDVTPRYARLGIDDVLEAADAEDLLNLVTIYESSAYLYDSVEIKMPRQETLQVQRVGVTQSFQNMHRLEVSAGRFISPFDERQQFAVLGAELATQLGFDEVSELVGKKIQAKTSIYTVIGVLTNSHAGPPGLRINESLLIPIELAERELATKEISGITLRMRQGVHYLDATEEITNHFQLFAPGRAIRVNSPVRIIEQMEAQMRMFTLLLGAVGGIALIVGGFGVMNAMLASVTERRLEIGIRRALGARQGDIQIQFLIESLILCSAAGLIGAVLGVGSTIVISAVTGWQWAWSPFAVFLGVGTSCAAGIFFGYHPAKQAARLDPIAAMRDL